MIGATSLPLQPLIICGYDEVGLVSTADTEFERG
jgi:hypothetical protein